MPNKSQKSSLEWDGYEIFQHPDYAKLYCKNVGKHIKEINKNFVYLTYNNLLGYTKLELYSPAEKDLKTSIGKCIEFCEKENIPKMVLKTPHEVEIGQITDTVGTYVIDLSKSTDEMWKNLKKETRNQVRQGEKKGIKVTIGDWADFQNWWRIYIKAVEEKTFPMTDSKLVRNIFKKNVSSKLFIAKVDDNLASGALIIHGKALFWWLGASNPELLSYRPNHSLQWEIIKWGKENGFTYYDLGGIKLDEPKHGPTKFKAGWGGELKKFNEYVIEFPTSKGKLIKLGRKYIPKKALKILRKEKRKRGQT